LKTSWEKKSERCKSLFKAFERLDEMEADGLVIRNKQSLLVTEKGRPFIRNICMAFDARLHQNKPETKLFSQTI
jgi:oxygen-independent coproporphyrinogen-3 oxidase